MDLERVTQAGRLNACNARLTAPVATATSPAVPSGSLGRVPALSRDARRITFRERPRGPEELWAQHLGSAAEVRRSAESLLVELRERHPRARVFIEGRGLRVPAVAGARAAENREASGAE